MTIDEKIKELEEKQLELSKEIEELEKEKESNNVRWRAIKGGHYYYIDTYGNLLETVDDTTPTDQYRWDINNYFKTERQAEIHKQNRLTYQQLKDIALRLNKGRAIDWNNLEQMKYFIYYDSITKMFGEGVVAKHIYPNNVYCIGNNFLKTALEEIGEEKLNQLLKWGI